LIVDDHGIVREGLKRIACAEQGIEVTGEAANTTAALDLLRSQPYDVVVLDINLPGRSGMDLLKIIKSELPSLPVVMLSASPEEQYAVRALRDGASGYLTKDAAPDCLVAAILKVASGGRYISPALAEHLADHCVAADVPQNDALTDRELQVLKLIASGKSTSQIAEELHLSPKTVGTYRARIQGKSGIRSNAQLTRYALELGILS
jgi:DNA-binding NarL/FixJ family response regulator